MGIRILPPDINESLASFSVAGDALRFGLVGIKNVGSAFVEELFRVRSEKRFTSFRDFVERMKGAGLNRKALESLIYAGAFDAFGHTRAALLSVADAFLIAAMEAQRTSIPGQISLFDTGVAEPAAQRELPIPDLPEFSEHDRLKAEKDVCGVYLSGHPLDDYKPIINKASTLDTSNLNRAQPKKKYTIVGMITDVRTIITKKNQPMAFAKLSDLNGEINLTFFPKTWEKLASKITPDTVWGITGEIDTTREDPSFNVDDAVRPEELAEHVTSQIHISLSPGFTEEQQLFELREFLFAASGNCFVYFHMAIGGKTYVVNASKQLTVPSSDDFIARISDFPYVESVWKE